MGLPLVAEPISVPDSGEIPLEDFVNNIRKALGADIPPDLAALLDRLRFASGPDIPGLIIQLLSFVPQSDDCDDAPVFSDYERF